jgi:hypothetical protein
MPLLNGRVEVRIRRLTRIKGGPKTAKNQDRYQVEIDNQPALGFNIGADLPSELLRKAKAEAKERFKGAFSIYALNLTARDKALLTLAPIEPRAV